MPRCQYCGEFFTGYTGNQVCADCHDHIVEMEKTIAQQQADIEALVRFVATIDGPDAWLWNNCGYERAAIQPIIERYRDE